MSSQNEHNFQFNFLFYFLLVHWMFHWKPLTIHLERSRLQHNAVSTYVRSQISSSTCWIFYKVYWKFFFISLSSPYMALYYVPLFFTHNVSNKNTKCSMMNYYCRWQTSSCCWLSRFTSSVIKWSFAGWSFIYYCENCESINSVCNSTYQECGKKNQWTKEQTKQFHLIQKKIFC